MTIQELVRELNKCPDKKAEVRYKNMEIDATCRIEKVIVHYDVFASVGSKYEVILK